MDIREDIRKLIGDELDRQDDIMAIDEETHLENDLGMDSLEMVSLQLAIEDAYGFEFNPAEDDFDDCFSTYGALCKCVLNKIKRMQ